MFVENKGLNPNSATKGKEDQINDLTEQNDIIVAVVMEANLVKNKTD